MKALFDLEQGSVDWHITRRGKVGGSSSKGLFVKSDTLLLEIVYEQTEPYDEFEETYVSAEMIRGIEMESEARNKLKEYTGICFIECGWIQSDIDLLGISPDGITEDLKHACEIKCPGGKKQVETAINNQIPLDNLHQCIHYFTVNDILETLTFLSYRPESIKPMVVITLNRETLVNIGTNARPVFKTIRDVVEIAKTEALKIESKVKLTIERLQF